MFLTLSRSFIIASLRGEPNILLSWEKWRQNPYRSFLKRVAYKNLSFHGRWKTLIANKDIVFSKGRKILENWEAKRRYLKRHDWRINFSSRRLCDRYLCCFSWSFSYKRLIYSWCSISKTHSHLLSWFQMSIRIPDSTDKSECVAKFRFDSVFVKYY